MFRILKRNYLHTGDSLGQEDLFSLGLNTRFFNMRINKRTGCSLILQVCVCVFRFVCSFRKAEMS